MGSGTDLKSPSRLREGLGMGQCEGGGQAHPVSGERPPDVPGHAGGMADPTPPSRKREGRVLGRVANGIFWMYRYLERAENTARLLAAGHRMALTRGADAATEEWRSVLTTLGLRARYEAISDDFATAHVCDFVLRG